MKSLDVGEPATVTSKGSRWNFTNILVERAPFSTFFFSSARGVSGGKERSCLYLSKTTQTGRRVTKISTTGEYQRRKRYHYYNDDDLCVDERHYQHGITPSIFI